MDFITSTNMFVLLILLLGLFFLQRFLSKQESLWLGLVLPIIFFLNSIVISLALFVDDHSTTELIFTILSIFSIVNIPTIVLLLIYFIVRKKQGQ